MLTVSLLIEIVRTRPRLVFWLVTLSQALLWFAIPAIFFSAPPGGVAELLAIGREMSFDPGFGPPLAPLAAELAMRATGHHVAGVYLLSQLCIVIAYGAVFQLGRATVGDRHATLAILLTTGIAVFTVMSPSFSADILMMPLWGLALLFLWRGCGQGRELSWLAFALMCGLMLLTSHLALLLIATVAIFLLVTRRGRASLWSPGAAVAIATIAFMVLASVAVLRQHGSAVLPDLARLRSFQGIDVMTRSGLMLLSIIVVAHAGALILILVSSNLPRRRQAEAAAVARAPIEPFARSFIYYFALVPPVAAFALVVLSGRNDLAALAPLFLLSGLALVVAGGDTILLYHQRILGVAWFALLLLPPVLTAAAVALLPTILGVDLKTAQPANAVARYLSENYERRTGRKLEFIAGDARLATLIGLASRERPRVIHLPGSGLPQLATADEARNNGAVVVWRATDNAGTPPAEIRAMYPNLVAEVPRAFERAVQGRAPLLRIGWGVVRPRSDPAP